MTTVQQLFAFLHPILGSMVDLLGLFHNYPAVVELILELFCECAKRCLCYLGHADSRILYQHSLAVIRMYAHHNQGKRSVEKEAEDEDDEISDEELQELLKESLIPLSSVAAAVAEPESHLPAEAAAKSADLAAD